MISREVRNLLLHTGSLLVDHNNPQIVSGEIRKLQKVLRKTTDKPSRPFTFLLDLILEDIFYNILGDGGYVDGLYDARNLIFRQIGKTFVVIGESAPETEEETTYKAFCELSEIYLGVLSKINDAFLLEKQ